MSGMQREKVWPLDQPSTHRTATAHWDSAVMVLCSTNTQHQPMRMHHANSISRTATTVWLKNLNNSA